MKKLDILLLTIFPFLATGLSLYFKTNFLVSIFLFFGLPSLWFTYRTPHKSLKTLIFASVFTIPMVLLIDYLAGGDASWHVATIFPVRILDTIPIEDFFVGFGMAYYTIIFYEHFLDKGKHDLIDKHMKYVIWPFILLFTVVLGNYFLMDKPLTIPYAYLWLGIILIIVPCVTFLSIFPRLLSKYVTTSAYFFLLYLIFEITALELEQWSFPGNNFIGWIELFQYRFPFEELFFWIGTSTIAILSYYEFFDDDRK
jgi:hypothetical protein